MINFGNKANLTMGLRWVSLALILFIALVFIAGQVVGLKGLDTALHKFSPGTLLLIILAVVASNVLRFYRWPYFAAAQNIHVPVKRLALYYTAGMALLPTPGKLGTALRLWLINRHHKIAYQRTLPLLLLDFITDAIAVTLLVAVALPWFGNASGAKLGVLVTALLLGGLVVVLYYPHITTRLLTLAQQAAGGGGKKLFAKAAAVLTDLRTLVGARHLAVTAGLSFAGWLLIALAFAALLNDMGHGFNFALAAFAIGGGITLGSLSLLPGGLGSTEATMVAVLLAGGVGLAEATVFTALFRLCTLWIPVGVGVLTLPAALEK